ncbi:3-oxoacyl-(acyl carrier protein) synthase [Vibrio aerogenes CECT 7868]|uniref:3-oxoacyl-(Acyl carrier protein) synthase n=1 Tax=Vibrio aerogenes CECT 7868 TaxID=1216006 RepID=A0A1M6AF63_9VIBR|nr:hypothetical protein [Vibrio aerogenes]SHI35170.1 3-oxoacyl-(acyl carrier protein) synthase [Vibrio aerogenes CECT 7868]
MKTELFTPAITADAPLSVLDIGLVTSLATGWKETSAAMRAGYDAFVHPENSLYPLAEVPFNPNVRGFTRMARLLELARQDLTHQYDSLPVLCALPGPERAGLVSFAETRQRVFDALAQLPVFQGKFIRNWLEFFGQGRCALAHQLVRAQEILTTTDYDKVMIMATDSWLFPQTLSSLLAGRWDSDPMTDKRRLLTSGNGEDNTDGFVPSEAAGILVVGRAEQHASPYLIDGVASADEPAPLFSPDVSRAEGLTAAIRQACDAAQTPFCDYPLRIASVSGEQYFFREASLAQTRNLTRRIPEQPLWHPASHIGETGCVSGIAMLAMAMDGFQHRYLPGERVLCHLSNDNCDRAALSVRYCAGTTSPLNQGV